MRMVQVKWLYQTFTAENIYKGETPKKDFVFKKFTDIIIQGYVEEGLPSQEKICQKLETSLKKSNY